MGDGSLTASACGVVTSAVAASRAAVAALTARSPVGQRTAIFSTTGRVAVRISHASLPKPRARRTGSPVTSSVGAAATAAARTLSALVPVSLDTPQGCHGLTAEHYFVWCVHCLVRRVGVAGGVVP